MQVTASKGGAAAEPEELAKPSWRPGKGSSEKPINLLRQTTTRRTSQVRYLAGAGTESQAAGAVRQSPAPPKSPPITVTEFSFQRPEQHGGSPSQSTPEAGVNPPPSCSPVRPHRYLHRKNCPHRPAAFTSLQHFASAVGLMSRGNTRWLQPKPKTAGLISGHQVALNPSPFTERASATASNNSSPSRA